MTMELTALRMFKPKPTLDHSIGATEGRVASKKKAKKRLPLKERTLREAIKLTCLWVALSPVVARPLYMGMVFQPDKHDYSELCVDPIKQLHAELMVAT